MKWPAATVASLLFAIHANAQEILKPDQIPLGANIRSESFVSDLGRVELRWPRSIEKCFGKAPNRAVGEALGTANKVLRRNSFPSSVKNSKKEWNLVFTDSVTAQEQFPRVISEGRHPGFMIPPHDIYIISDFVSGTCYSAAKEKTPEIVLARVLVHEIGHVIEYLLLHETFGGERARAEGFATWFEAQGMSLAGARWVENEVKQQAKNALLHGASLDATSFSGSGEEYSLWASYLGYVVDKKGLGSLVKAYELIVSSKMSIKNAVYEVCGISPKDAEKEILRFKSV